MILIIHDQQWKYFYFLIWLIDCHYDRRSIDASIPNEIIILGRMK